MWIRWAVISLSFLFGCGIVGVSLVSAATVFPAQLNPTTTPAGENNSVLLPGQLFYPMHAASQKVQLYFMEEPQRADQSLALAHERWESAKQLIELEQFDQAVLTLIKGHQYVAQVVPYAQDHGDEVLKNKTLQSLTTFRVLIENVKPRFSDQQKVLLDQALAENEALLIHLGSSPQQ